MIKRQVAETLVEGQIYFTEETARVRLKFVGTLFGLSIFEYEDAISTFGAQCLQGYNPRKTFWEDVEVADPNGESCNEPKTKMSETEEGAYYVEALSCLIFLLQNDVLSPKQFLKTSAKIFKDNPMLGASFVSKTLHKQCPEKEEAVAEFAKKQFMKSAPKELKDLMKLLEENAH
jgi:hypothetical protein